MILWRSIHTWGKPLARTKGLPSRPQQTMDQILSDIRDSKEEKVVLKFRRVHETGTDALVTQHSDGWRIHINLREPNHNPGTIIGYLSPTDCAQEFADNEIAEYGHVCNGACQEWMMV